MPAEEKEEKEEKNAYNYTQSNTSSFSFWVLNSMSSACRPNFAYFSAPHKTLTRHNVRSACKTVWQILFRNTIGRTSFYIRRQHYEQNSETVECNDLAQYVIKYRCNPFPSFTQAGRVLTTSEVQNPCSRTATSVSSPRYTDFWTTSVILCC